MWRINHLHDADAGSNIDEEIWENTRIDVRKTVFGIAVALIDEDFVVDVLQEEIATFNKASHLFFLVNPVALKS